MLDSYTSAPMGTILSRIMDNQRKVTIIMAENEVNIDPILWMNCY
jgi:hypothetical protein